ncbi:flagellar biosynthesis protein FliQ [Anaeroarcus burkinensis]|uniref:flagellar biosynthesis protein FliQ n=1 Tax=Anaeroarcus burkinensis TaxID=82376 RepID=UPI0004831F1C|nr:flagellar biosynthesis protein FliQ [Anaeroarcus burkinensis]NCB76711.1 flagellar biosynthetic protein FliQ [Negativicutes bacterium]
MSADYAVELGRDALLMVMLVSAPMLGLGLLVGLLVSVFQATTQIQEQTLAFIPKIIAVFVAILIFGPWMLRLLMDYMQQLLLILPKLSH